MAKSIKPQVKTKVQPKATPKPKATTESKAGQDKSNADVQAKAKATPKAKAEPKEKKPVLPLTEFTDAKIINQKIDEEKIFIEFEVPTADGSFIERHVGKGDKKKSFYGNITYLRNLPDKDAKNPMVLINRHDDFTRTQKKILREYGENVIKEIRKTERENSKAAKEKAKAENKAKVTPKAKTADTENVKTVTPKAKTKAAPKVSNAKASPKKPVAKKK